MGPSAATACLVFSIGGEFRREPIMRAHTFSAPWTLETCLRLNRAPVFGLAASSRQKCSDAAFVVIDTCVCRDSLGRPPQPARVPEGGFLPGQRLVYRSPLTILVGSSRISTGCALWAVSRRRPATNQTGPFRRVDRRLERMTGCLSSHAM